MKKHIVIFSFFAANIIFFLNSGLSQWLPDYRITNDPAASVTSIVGWCIASSGNVLHIVWQDNRNSGVGEIYYKRSSDAGDTWGQDTRLTNNPASSQYPTISVSDSNVYIAWQDWRDGGGNGRVYFKSSINAGLEWGIDKRLIDNSAGSTDPCLASNGLVVHIVWLDVRDGDFQVYYKRSLDGGLNWEPDRRMSTSNNTASGEPCVCVSGQIVHVVWSNNRYGNDDIFYMRSTDGGVNWGSETRLVNNVSPQHAPCVAASGQNVHVVWNDDRDATDEIYYKRSSDGGVTWGNDTRLTNASGFSEVPKITLSGNNIHLIWEDTRDGNAEIYYKRSTNGGLSWESDTRLTNDTAKSYYPSSATSGTSEYVVWQDFRNSNWEIYFKRNTTVNVLINNIGNIFPADYNLEQNYPNPFNPVTKIKFEISQHTPYPLSRGENVTLKIYDILGKEIQTLVNEQLQPGTYEVTFDGGNLPSGVYFYQLRTGEYTETKKLVLLK